MPGRKKRSTISETTETDDEEDRSETKRSARKKKIRMVASRRSTSVASVSDPDDEDDDLADDIIEDDKDDEYNEDDNEEDDEDRDNELVDDEDYDERSSRKRKSRNDDQTSDDEEDDEDEMSSCVNPWDHMFYELMVYKAIRGHFNVSSKSKKYPRLFKWAEDQRRQYKVYKQCQEKGIASTSKLTTEQVKVLESVDFPFEPAGSGSWQLNFEKLVKFKDTFGHTSVPSKCDIPGLAAWVAEQRREFKKFKEGRHTTLSLNRRKQLDDVGFVWEVRNRPEWDSRYNELIQYKEANGDTRVPQFYELNRRLGKWVAKQRQQYTLKNAGKHSLLTPYREEKLNEIGFDWSVSSARRSTRTPPKKANRNDDVFDVGDDDNCDDELDDYDATNGLITQEE